MLFMIVVLGCVVGNTGALLKFFRAFRATRALGLEKVVQRSQGPPDLIQGIGRNMYLHMFITASKNNSHCVLYRLIGVVCDHV